MSISVIVATYGDLAWMELGETRAVPSIVGRSTADVIIHHDDDGNVASSRNAGAAAASGEWLCFCDADDELGAGYVNAMQFAATGRDHRTLFTPAVQVIRPNRVPGPPTFFKEVPLRDANWLVIGTLVHCDLFWEVGGFDNHPHGFEDWALWSKCVRAGASIVKVPDAVYRYWVNPQSKHREGWRDKKWQHDTHQRIEAELDAWEAARAPAA